MKKYIYKIYADAKNNTLVKHIIKNCKNYNNIYMKKTNEKQISI